MAQPRTIEQTRIITFLETKQMMGLKKSKGNQLRIWSTTYTYDCHNNQFGGMPWILAWNTLAVPLISIRENFPWCHAASGV